MKLKSLLFGSAAAIAAGTGAQAADLPIVEPVEYVRICDAFGPRFYYIPGTDTCLRVAGRVRVESHYVDGDNADLNNFYGIGNANRVNNWTTRARGYVRLDARTQTDIGLVRTYISMFMTVGPAQVTGNGQDENYGGSTPTLEYAFIQISNDWGTYTAGHADSFFDFYDHHGFYNARGVGIDASTTQMTLFGWTFAGGNGFSFTVAAQDPASAGFRANGDDDYEGQEFPDGVANIRVDQGWGSAQIMGAVRHINDDNGDGIGFAVGAGAKINIPGGWEIAAMGGYSEGAIRYITGDPGGWGDFDGPTGDQKNEAWAVKAGITGPIFTNVSVWADGSFVHVEEADVGASGDEYDNWGIAVGGLWNPVSGLVMGPEFAYESHDQTDPSGDEGGSANDWDVWSIIWRVQRDF